MRALTTLATKEGAAEPVAGCVASGLREPGAAATLPVAPSFWAHAGSEAGFLGWALVAPLLNRIRRGEGGLLVVTFLLAWKGNPGIEAIGLSAICALCLLSLYLFNDVTDAEADLRNPKKDQALVAVYARHSRAFLAAWLLLSFLAFGAASFWGSPNAVALVTVSIVNVVYSLLCKRIPYLDLLTVGAWGGSFAAIACSDASWWALAGIMTAVCHVYQASEDRAADRANDIHTSAALPAPRLWLLQVGLALAMVAAAWSARSGLLAWTFLAFVLYWYRWRHEPRVGWFWSKAHFALVVLWLVATA